MELSILKAEKIYNSERELITINIPKEGVYNLNDYMLVLIPFDQNEQVIDFSKNGFRFPVCEVKANDSVKVFIEEGENRVDSNSVGGSIHSFYWMLNKKLLNQIKSKIILMKISIVDSKTIL